MTDLAALARSLTKAQREVIQRGGPGDHPMATVYAMLRKGLIYHKIDSPNGRCGPMELTETGLALRAHLTAQAGE